MTRYRPGGPLDRLPIRAAHIEYMLEWLPRTVFGGAIWDEEPGEGALGMVVAIDVETRSEAEAFITAEPYNRAGLFSDVCIWPVRQMTPPNTPDFLQSELKRARS